MDIILKNDAQNYHHLLFFKKLLLIRYIKLFYQFEL